MILQFGTPGVAELALVNLVLALVTGFLVYRDADARGASSPTLWGLGMGLAALLLSFLGFLLAVVAYYLLVVRD